MTKPAGKQTHFHKYKIIMTSLNVNTTKLQQWPRGTQQWQWMS